MIQTKDILIKESAVAKVDATKLQTAVTKVRTSKRLPKSIFGITIKETLSQIILL